MKDLKRIVKLAKTILTRKDIANIKTHEARAECGKNETYYHFFREVMNTSKYGVRPIEWYLAANDELLLRTLKEVRINKEDILTNIFN